MHTLGTVLFICAVIHGLGADYIKNFFPRSPLGEMEWAFGLWALLLLLAEAVTVGPGAAFRGLTELPWAEPLFVVGMILVAGSEPVVALCQRGLLFLSAGARRWFRTPAVATDLFFILGVGALLGSLITEAAAMTITAVLLRRRLRAPSIALFYGLLGALFVNISVGGALTHFAAPPILMVAARWGWSTPTVFVNLGWKCFLIVGINAFGYVIYFRRAIGIEMTTVPDDASPINNLGIVHLGFLAALIYFSSSAPSILTVLVLFFIFVRLTRARQGGLYISQSLRVGVFLISLISFSPWQSWWLEPALQKFSLPGLFFGASALTAIIDNTALTYLGSQVLGPDGAWPWALVGGAIAGGGLTLIANAPNPAGYSLLADKIPGGKLSSLALFAGALPATVVALICLWYL